MNLLLELHFLPSLEYFCALQRAEQVVIEKHEHFVKQSYRSRCFINTSQGVDMIRLPLTQKSGRTAITEVKLDYSSHWQNYVWRTLESNYRKAPFFEHYAPAFHRTIYGKPVWLFDFNLELLSICLHALKWSKPILFTDAYQEVIPLDMKDLRSHIEAKKTFETRGIYRPQPYYQVFGSSFAANLSILDLLFCEGPRAGLILKQSQAV